MELSAGGDTVTIDKPKQMTDEDIAPNMQLIEERVNDNPIEALSVYGNLSYSRVMNLLYDPE